ncbi:MAG: aldo/keto reductase [Candidatus Hydrogenedentes bacterium]|nr:aldo/keto reductase [Candidatus Hydrogenedentota bacterium]
MEYRQLGKWGLRVSCLGMGTHMTLGHSCDEATSRAMVRAAYDGGVNFFDTANAYAHGEAERMLGLCLKEYPRSSVVVLSKVSGMMGPGPNDRGLSAKHIREQCDASLQRLGMEYIDIYLCHRPHTDTPLEETIRAMEDLARAGKILYWGVSEWPVALIVQANALAQQLGARPIAASEPRYNLLYRQPESSLFPTTAEQGIGNLTFSPLGHGVLAGIYKPGEAAPPGTRAADTADNAVPLQLYYNEENKRKAAELVRIAAELGTSAAVLSTAWCLTNSNVSSVIFGAWTEPELRENLKAADLLIPEDVQRRIEELFPAPSA